MNCIQKTEQTLAVLAAVKNAPTAKEALELLAELAGTPIYQEKHTVGYTESSGVPNKWEWRPCKEWDGTIDWNLDILPHRYEDILVLIPENRTLILHLKEKVVVVTRVQVSSGPHEHKECARLTKVK